MLCLTLSPLQAETILNAELDGQPYPILLSPAHEILPDVTPMVLGAINQSSLLEAFGRALGGKAIEASCEAALVGIPRVLDLSREDFSLYFSSSPYLAAQTIRDISWGLLSVGVFPVLDLRKGYDREIIRSLMSRKIFPGLLIDEKDWPDSFLEGTGLGIITEEGKWIQHPHEWKRLPWKSPIQIPEDLRIQLLIQSITTIKRTRQFDTHTVVQSHQIGSITDKGVVFYLRPDWMPLQNFLSGVLVFSLDSRVIQAASDILKGLQPARGRKTW